MRIPISHRLLACAELVPPGARVADVGCDHGYLSVYLLKNALASYVVAADLREKPLQTARANAARFGISQGLRFALGDGLRPVHPGEADTVVCAGMGGDTIAAILARCPWVRNPACTLILQPQSSGNDLRRWLGENQFSILREKLVRDGGFLYAVMEVRFGGGLPLTPGHQYVSQPLLSCGSALLGEYLMRVEQGVRKAVEGISRAAAHTERSAYYEAALAEIQEMRNCYDNRPADS